MKAERENATVYLQRIPNFADLPPIQPYILVKSLSLPDIDAAGETLFQTVIPDNRYSVARCEPSCPHSADICTNVSVAWSDHSTVDATLAALTVSYLVQCPELLTAANRLSVLLLGP